MATEQNNLTLGVDVGGTKMLLLVMTEDGEVVDRVRRPTDADGGPEQVVHDIAQCVNEQFSDKMLAVQSAGLGIAGLVNRRTGTLISAPNLSMEETPLGPMLNEQIDRPVLVLNDVDAATYAEWKHGAARGFRNVIGAFLGTGVGGGIITEGHLLEGERSSAAEIGHMPIVEGGRKCNCGNHGCLEAYAGGWAIGERARERVASEPDRGDVLVDLAGGPEQITAEIVSKAGSQGDELALELIERTGNILGAWASGLVNVFNPDRIILGGSVGKGFPHFSDAIESHVRNYSFDEFLETFDVREAEYEDRAVAMGAGAMAYREFT